MAALLLEIGPGDEVIMPSWTFASSANAIVMRGAVPVFVDVDPQTLNINTTAVAAALTQRTKAVLCVHYAGVGCDMDTLFQICLNNNLGLIEDAAQAVDATWRGQPLGGIGNFGAFSFHSTKNISCGEGGALLVRDEKHQSLAEIAWEKGTNRLQFLRGEIESYEWVSSGSSYLPSEITAAFLSSSLGTVKLKTLERLASWNYYDEQLRKSGADQHLILPDIPTEAQHNGHIYHVRHKAARHIREALFHDGIHVTSHYHPLHSSEGGKRFGRLSGSAQFTNEAAVTLLRLPLFVGLSRDDQDYIVDRLYYWANKFA